MLHLITYDLQDSQRTRDLIYAKARELGDPYFCMPSAFFISTCKNAGEVDAELKKLLASTDSIFVVDISGIDVNKYFGRVHATVDGVGLWKWILSKKDA